MGEMIERVAKAIDPHAFADWQRRFDYEMGKSGDAIEAKAFADWGGGSRKSEALEKALAAIEAMRQPDDAMVEQGGRQQASDRGGPDSIWRAMIGAALSRSTSKEEGNG